MPEQQSQPSSSQPTKSTLIPALSDESSFYGSETETTNLESQASTYSTHHYWTNIHPHLYSTIQHDRLAIQAQTQTQPQPSSSTTPSPSPSTPSPHSPTESLATFLSRLPPSTGPWIYIQAPTYQPPQTNIPALLTDGRRALEQYENERSALEAQRDHPGTLLAHEKSGLTRRLGTLRQNLEKRILEIARRANVVSGKWMLFVLPGKVDEVWGV
ncbi:DUF1917-domain-containing protein, partial [Aspergillus ibericus CBS 121593]